MQSSTDGRKGEVPAATAQGEGSTGGNVPTEGNGSEARAHARLEADGLVERQGEQLRTTRKWQSAMARAARRLVESGDPGRDLRVPIAMAMVELYGAEVSAEELAPLVVSMVTIELRELQPELDAQRAGDEGADGAAGSVEERRGEKG